MMNNLGRYRRVYKYIKNLERKSKTGSTRETKALFRKDAKKIEFGKEVWGDFDLLLGAAKLNLKIVEVPVHYKARVAGRSKMRTFRYATTIIIIALRGIWEFKIAPLLS